MTELLKNLTDAIAPSGNEEGVHKIIENELKDYCDDITKDVMGNLIVHKKGNGKKVMFAAHCDEIGFMVTYIEDEGFLRIAAVGGIDNCNILNRQVVFKNGTVGVIGCPTNDEKAAHNLKINQLFVDIGVKDKKEAEEKVSIGDMCVFVNNYTETDDVIISKSLDNRIGCYVLIEAIKEIKSSPNDLYFVFTSQEEIGLRGATTSAYAVDPDYAIAVDVCDTGDTPDAEKNAVKLGAGVGIHVKDRRMIVTGPMKNLMFDLADEIGLSYQSVVCDLGSTDGAVIQPTRSGVMAGVLDIPTRYIHSPSEMVNKKDVNDAIKYVIAFAEKPF